MPYCIFNRRTGYYIRDAVRCDDPSLNPLTEDLYDVPYYPDPAREKCTPSGQLITLSAEEMTNVYQIRLIQSCQNLPREQAIPVTRL